MLAQSIVSFYRRWHGHYRLPGAGFLLRHSSRYVTGLQRYPLHIRGIGTITVDFRDHAGLLWLQQLVGDRLSPFDGEDQLTRAIRTVMKNGDTFWDVGASIGMISIAVKSLFPASPIYAFEPNPFLCESLQAFFGGHRTIQVLPYALSDTTGTATLTIPKAKSVGASIRGLEYVLNTSGYTMRDVVQVTAQTMTGDTLIKNGKVPPPRILKLDVEGHELAVLKGFADTIATHHPIIFFEHLYLTDNEIAGLVPQGYTLHAITNDTGKILDTFERQAGHNSVLMPAF